MIITGIVILVLIVCVTACVKIVPQANAYVIERLGTYQTTWDVGLHFKVPFVDTIAKKVSIKEKVIDFAPRSEERRVGKEC